MIPLWRKSSLKNSLKNRPRPYPTPFLAVFLFVATLVAYLPALSGALLWDDDQHVTQPALQSLHGLWPIWFEPGATAQYYPLLHSAFWLEHSIWGDAVLPYHLLNITLQAISAFLVVLIARRLGLPGATLAGFLFALHPVCVEAVAAYLAALGLFVLAMLSKPPG